MVTAFPSSTSSSNGGPLNVSSLAYSKRTSSFLDGPVDHNNNNNNNCTYSYFTLPALHWKESSPILSRHRIKNPHSGPKT
ncbi:uncharacterized protein LAJ45_05794 [Morchella importuna]|uniref:uncharacterized protein n=1 Tax=Morchella importuna TaxID=1174673 RepID=UPI001E8EDF33|nr:uncharacterized protein LAJ45_05794 [Morchella importuna]KAH8150108.1 hypothetical protein LAJ45_05794 [Morchella importuna]